MVAILYLMKLRKIKYIRLVTQLEKAMAPTPVLFPGKSHGWRSLVGCSPWGHEDLDTTEQLHFHFSLSCIGEGNGNPLQCSCLENPRDAEPGGLPSMGSHRVGHDWSNLAAAAAVTQHQVAEWKSLSRLNLTNLCLSLNTCPLPLYLTQSSCVLIF